MLDLAWYINFGDGATTGYYAAAKWAASTAKVCGNVIRQNTTPAANNERCFVCVSSTGGTGQTGATEPTWTITRGAVITDNSVTWQEATGVAALNGDLTNTPTWNAVKGATVTLGQVIQSNDGTKILIAKVGGVAGSGSEPSWAAYTAAGATTSDNTVTWVTLGASFASWAAPHARTRNAYTATWGQAGNTFYVGDNHAETVSTVNYGVSFPGTLSSPCYAYCVDHTKVAPFASGDLRTTATISTTGTANMSIGGGVGNLYEYGISYFCTATTNVGITLGPLSYRLENGGLHCGNAGSSATITFGPTFGNCRIDCINCQFGVGNAFGALNLRSGEFNFIGGSSVGTMPASFIGQSTGGCQARFVGVDLSLLGAGASLIGGGSGNAGGTILMQDCKLGAGCARYGTPTVQPGADLRLIRCDSGAANYVTEKWRFEGNQVTETSVVLSGGASDGTTAASIKISTSANARWACPFESLPIVVWNDTAGSPVTVTVEGTVNAASLPKNDDIWLTAEYLGSSGSPLASFKTSTKADNLAAGSAVAASGAAWGGGGSGTGWSPFKLAVTFTPQQKGFIFLYVNAAKPSTTFYIDPQPTLS